MSTSVDTIKRTLRRTNVNGKGAHLCLSSATPSSSPGPSRCWCPDALELLRLLGGHRSRPMGGWSAPSGLRAAAATTTTHHLDSANCGPGSSRAISTRRRASLEAPRGAVGHAKVEDIEALHEHGPLRFKKLVRRLVQLSGRSQVLIATVPWGPRREGDTAWRPCGAVGTRKWRTSSSLRSAGFTIALEQLVRRLVQPSRRSQDPAASLRRGRDEAPRSLWAYGTELTH